MSNTNLVTKKLSILNAEKFVEEARATNPYYVFAAKHTPYANTSDQVIPTPLDSIHDTSYGIYNDMIFGKRVNDNDISLVIPRYDWELNTVYTMYDDDNTKLSSERFYACVNVGSYSHVYKCLYNNGGSPSVVEPSGTDPQPFETPEDGYIWKYMYTANDSLMAKFATSKYIPVNANNDLIANSISGSIDIIKVEVGGRGYNNYLVSSFESPSDLKVNGNPRRYALGAQAVATPDFYNNCIIKITSGNARDEYRIIQDYYIDDQTGQKIIFLDDVFSGVIQPTDTYEIFPFVFVFDTGSSKQSNCIARAIIDSTSGNSVSKIEVLSRGSGYRSANAVLLPDPAVAVQSNAALRVIIPPVGGHGSNPYFELGASYVGLAVKFLGDETPLTIQNDYRTIGVLREPLFANVNIKIDVNKTIGSFVTGEKIYQYTPVPLAGTVQTNSTSTAIVGNNTFFDSLTVGDGVIISDGLSNIYANVASIVSNTQITLNHIPSFNSTGCTIQLVKDAAAYGTMIANSAGEIFVNVSSAGLSNSTNLLGESSYCTSVVDAAYGASAVTINGRGVDSFNKFTQLTRFLGTVTAGTFIQDEVVTQDSAMIYDTPSARLHSVINSAEAGPNDIMYVTNVINTFQTEESVDSDGIINGEGSQAQFVLTAKYNGDLVPDSGEILYLENLSPVTRSNTQTETIKLILEF